MSDPNLKGVKRSSTRQTSAAASAKNRPPAGKSAHPAPLVKRPAVDKAPARKAAKAKTAPAKASKQSTKHSPAEKTAVRKPGSKVASTAKPAKLTQTTVAAKATKKPVPQAKSAARTKPLLQAKQAPQAKPHASAATTRKPAQPPIAVQHRQPTRDEAAALRAFERAHKEFARGRFAEARTLFRALVEEHVGVSEITARARTYLAVAETRLRSAPTLPHDADSLYDRGVIELNRGEFVAAQELFERALKREPEAAHVHYGLAATRARLGSTTSALESLQRALDLNPRLRVRAQHDQDLATLRSDPEFDALMFAPRS